jgi:hypothetical protein
LQPFASAQQSNLLSLCARLHVSLRHTTRCACAQNGKQAAFGLLEQCKRLAQHTPAKPSSSRLLVGLQEAVQHIQPLGDGGGVEVVTQHRRCAAGVC